MKWRWIEKYNMTMTPLPHREGVFRAWEQTHKGKGDDESKDQMCWKKKSSKFGFPNITHNFHRCEMASDFPSLHCPGISVLGKSAGGNNLLSSKFYRPRITFKIW